ncbi:MAG: hypothetical protein HKN43_06300 [Rhodothermales bacterium]|nr:hypothetical protein [Rhodothermales bacterium]
MSQRATNRPVLIALVIFIALGAPRAGIGQDHKHEHDEREKAGSYSLLNNLGDHHFSITTTNARAQEFFDQGLRLYYGFNHAEAIKSFAEAQRLDPSCAMCYWGEALAYGPNINMPMDQDGAQAASVAIEVASSLKDKSSPLEQQLIGALQERYRRTDADERSDLDESYATSMHRVRMDYPDNVEVAVLHAEAVMTTMPWDYWNKDQTPKPEFEKALGSLRFAMESNPNHPGACHFYIHGVEKYFPEMAVECAERLAALMPGAGHIVHMPGHIYIRVGRYDDAIRANQHAVHADETYIQDRRPGVGVYTAGYYPHNYDFMAFAASMIGDCDLAVEAANNVRNVIPQEVIGQPGFEFLQHYYTRPVQMLVGCNRWDEILNYDQPDETLEYANLIWHYARGRALAATGDLPAAQVELGFLEEARTTGKFVGVTIEPNTADQIIAIAEQVLAGWIASASGQQEAAIQHMRKGVLLEDGLLYGEPPEWSVPVRHDLGAMQLAHNDLSGAEKTFREALQKFPNNEPSLAGLNLAQEGQSR